MAVFRQTTSRADDPQIHTHAVISAKVQTADGRWLALDARYLKKHQRMLGGLYQSVLRNELTHRLGVEWGPIVNGQAEIAGVPEGSVGGVLQARRRRSTTPWRSSSTSSVTVRAGTRHRRSAPPWSVKPRPTPGAASPGSVSPIWRHGGRARRQRSAGPSNGSSRTSNGPLPTVPRLTR